MKFYRIFKPWLICLAAALFFSYELVQMHMLNAISPMLMKDLHLNASSFSYLCVTYLLADVIFLLPAGMILDRFSVRKVILWALFLCIFGTFGFSLSQNLIQASIGHFLSGIGNGFCFLSCMILVSRWFPPHKQAFVVGIVVTIGLLGGVIAQTPFAWLAEMLTWRQTLFIDGLIGLFIFLLIFFVVQDSSQKKPEGSIQRNFFSDLRFSLSNKQNIFAGVYTGLMNLPLMILGAMWGTLYCHQIHHLSLSKSSFVTSLICLGTIVGSPMIGKMSDRMQRRKPIMIYGSLVSFLIVCLILFQPISSSFLSLATLFFLLGLSTSSQIIGYPVITESNPSYLTGTAMGV